MSDESPTHCGKFNNNIRIKLLFFPDAVMHQVTVAVAKNLCQSRRKDMGVINNIYLIYEEK